MERVKVSARYEIRIPEEIRQRLNIQPNQELMISVSDGAIWLSPLSLDKKLLDIKELRGIARGLTWKREDRDRRDRS
jgi:AbrB family looped-hinge helix DNA binding protein